MSTSEEDDDPVVSEVDVYLSKQLCEQLMLLQYPVRPRHVSYDGVRHLSARVKPKQQKLELELAMNTRSPNYATSKGEQIALNVDGSTPEDKDRYYESDRMDKQVLGSSSVGVDTGRFVVGTFRDRELHLTPLKSVLQMRPTFKYLDQADTKTRDLTGEDSQDDEEPDAKQVMVKFARQETEEAKARRMASYDYLRREADKERWMGVDFHPPADPMAEAERCRLYAHRTEETGEFFLAQADYLKKLIPKEETEVEKMPAMPNNVLSMVELKTMALSDQIRALLMSAKLIRFSQLLSLLPTGTDPTAVLRLVQQVAMLVQGCWVVKSEILNPKDSFSANSGVPAETLARGRDYVMWRFTRCRHMVRKDIASVIKLPAEDVKDILQQMARLKVNRGWEFLMDFDTEFVNRHTEVVQRQEMLWERKFQQLSESLTITKADLKLAAAPANVITSPKRRRTVSRSRTKSGGEMSMSDFSDMDVDPVKSERQRRASGSERPRRGSGSERQRHASGSDRSRHASGSDRQRHGSGHGKAASTPRQRKISLMDSSADESIPASLEINGIAEMMDLGLSEPSAAAESKSNGSSDLALKAELIKFASDRLFSRYVLTLSSYRDLFMRKLAECPPGHVLSAGISDKSLEQSLLDVGARRVNIGGPHREPIYIRDKVGDGLDEVRTVMVDMLQEKPSIKINLLRKRIEESGLEVPPDTELRKLLKDYCTVKGSYWHLKCTLQHETS